MIRRIHLTNYQSHRDTDIELSSSINALVGTSRAGKTAILRALRWVLCNRPSGESFRRHGTEETAVSLDVDGVNIRRRRTKSANEYLVDGAPVRAFGTGVPEEVAALIGFEDGLSNAGQHDAPYMLGMSPIDLARALNEFAGLDVADAAVAEANRRAVAAARDARAADVEVDRHDDLVKSLGWTAGAAKEVAGLKERARVAGEAEEALRSLRALTARVAAAVREVAATDGLENILELAATCGAVRDLTSTDRERLRRLRELASWSSEAAARVRATEALEDAEALAAHCSEAAKALGAERRGLQRLGELIDDATFKAERFDIADKDLKVAVAVLRRECPAVCPTCGEPTDPEKIIGHVGHCEEGATP